MHVPTRRAPRADLPTAWGGDTSPPGCARSARRPPRGAGRRHLPTRRAPRADLPTAWGGDSRRPPRRDRLRLAGPRAGWYSAPKPWPDGFSAWLGLNVPTKGHFVVYWRFVHARPLILPIS